MRKDPMGWLLQGLVVCGLCGHTLACRQRDPSSRRVYVSRGRDKEQHVDGSDRCALRKIDADWLENEVWSKFAEALSDSGALRKSVDDAVAKLEKRRGELQASSQHIDRQLQRINNRIRNLVQAMALAEHDLAESDLDDFKERLEKFRKEKADLEARKANLDPESQVELSRLENNITRLRRLLDEAWPLVELDGIWTYTFSETGGLVTAERFRLGLDGQATVEKCARARECGGVDLLTRVESVSQKPKEDCIRIPRAILRKFDVRPLAFPDRVEIRGLIPSEVIKLPVDGRRAKGGQKISSVY